MLKLLIVLLGCFLLCSTFFIGISNGQLARLNFRHCNSTTAERTSKANITEVSMDPCSNAPDGPCPLSASRNATISVTFIPGEIMHNGTRHGLYWDTTVQMELRGLPKKACIGIQGKGFVNCTAPADQPRTYGAVIPLKRTFPKRQYDVKVKLYHGNRKVYACVIVPINLID